MKKLTVITFFILTSFNAFACLSRPTQVKGTGLTASTMMVVNELGDKLYESGKIISKGIEYEVILSKDVLDKLELRTLVIYNPKTFEKVVITKVIDRRRPQPRGVALSAGMERSVPGQSKQLELGQVYEEGSCGNPSLR